MNKIGIMIPTRSRSDRLKKLYESYLDFTEGLSDFVVGIDTDQKDLYDWVKDPIVIIDTKNEDYVSKANYMASKMDKYDYLYLLSDDFIIESKFESVFLNNAVPNCVLYGSDGIQNEILPTACFMDNNIPRKLGYIASPRLIHYYADNCWMVWGKKLKTYKYLPEIKVTHDHVIKNKEVDDEVYRNSSVHFQSDKQAFEDYLSYDFNFDINKL